jgi:hypothetical protein
MYHNHVPNIKVHLKPCAQYPRCSSNHMPKACLKHVPNHPRYVSQTCAKTSKMCSQPYPSSICQLINDIPQTMCQYMPQTMYPSIPKCTSTMCQRYIQYIQDMYQQYASIDMPQTMYQTYTIHPRCASNNEP